MPEDGSNSSDDHIQKSVVSTKCAIVKEVPGP